MTTMKDLDEMKIPLVNLYAFALKVTPKELEKLYFEDTTVRREMNKAMIGIKNNLPEAVKKAREEG